MLPAMQELISILDLERLEHNLYRGRSPKTSWQRVFGGQVIAQALVAAQRTVDEAFHVHSLHAYFMLPGDPSVPIVYDVDRIRNGRSFVTRRVNAIQHGHAIFSLMASFQKEEDGLDHQFDMPSDIPDPDKLMSHQDLVAQFSDQIPEPIRKYWMRERPIEMRPVLLDHYMSQKKLPPHQNIWIRTASPVPDDRHLQSAILAYVSDMTLLDTATFPHGRAVFDRDLQVASLDHSMWFHRSDPLDDWLLYAQASPSSSGSRGLTRGGIYSRNGTLIASVAQEGLIRVKKPKN